MPKSPEILNLDQTITYTGSLKGAVLMNELVAIAQKATDFNPNPVEMKEMLAGLDRHELQVLRTDLEKIIADNQVIKP